MVKKYAEPYPVPHPKTPHHAGDFPPVIGEMIGAYREAGFVAANGFPGTQEEFPLGTFHIDFEERDGKIEITNHFI
jgi:hypothetical protein